MANIYFYHDTRSGKGEFPIKIRIQHNKGKALLNTGIKVTPEQWDNENGVIINHEKSRKYNAIICSSFQNAQETIDDLKMSRKLNNYTAQQLKDIIEKGVDEWVDSNRVKFRDYYISCINRKSRNSTKSSYQQALNNLERFDENLAEKTFEDIDLGYLQDLDAWFASREVTVNSRAVYYRNIKSVFNDAINEELTTAYPFRRFKIKTTPTKKRNLSIDELRLLLNYPIEDEWKQKYRDIFMLCFYMRGINIVDLLGLTKDNIRAGRINYIRSKTGKFYSIKIEPEMQAIMRKYKGKQYLIDVCDGTNSVEEFETRYKGFLKRMDKGLKKIGPYTRSGRGGKMDIKPILPNLSQYWCRHTTATLMHNMGYSRDLVGCSLGHDIGKKVTNIYIEYNETEVDEANRKLIDFVNKK